MKVTLYSEKLTHETKMGWHRGCSNISYVPNSIRKGDQFGKTYNTLTFTYNFQYTDDTVFFAYCFPYTYSDLMDDLITIDSDPAKTQLE